MSRKIIGVTVGTSLSPNKIKENLTPELTKAVNTALAQAKASGEFNGKDGYTPIKGVDYFDGKDGEPGKDYVLTPSDKQEIADLAAGMVDIPDTGGNVAYDEAQNLTEEQKAQARENIGAQPAGNYLTEVPEGYAKKEDIPSLDGYAKTTDIPSLEGYAKSEDVPTDEHINSLINTALGVIENGTY